MMVKGNSKLSVLVLLLALVVGATAQSQTAKLRAYPDAYTACGSGTLVLTPLTNDTISNNCRGLLPEVVQGPIYGNITAVQGDTLFYTTDTMCNDTIRYAITCRLLDNLGVDTILFSDTSWIYISVSPLPDVYVSAANAEVYSDTVTVTVDICNQGFSQLVAPYYLSLSYADDSLMLMDTIRHSLAAGSCDTVEILLRGSTLCDIQTDSFIVRVNSDGVHIAQNAGLQTECDTTNNVQTFYALNHNDFATPQLSFTIEPDTIGCAPFTIRIANHTTGHNSYVWRFGDGEASYAASPSHVYGVGNFQIVSYVTSSVGCQDSLRLGDSIRVYPTPVAEFSWTPDTVPIGFPHVWLNNDSPSDSAGSNYLWLVQSGYDDTLHFDVLYDSIAHYSWAVFDRPFYEPSEYIIRLVAYREYLTLRGDTLRCSDTASHKVPMRGLFLQFPNVVTANGDGINDRFVIRGLLESKGFGHNSLYIYNRWGRCIYHCEDIDEDEDFWDPAAANVPAGTYFWIFKGAGLLGQAYRSGTVEVLKE